MAAKRKRAPAGAVGVSEGSLDPKHFLGRVATFTLPDDPRSGAKLVRSWNKHGLDVDDLPDARQPVHVFQSACSSVNQRRTDNGTRTEIRADEVLNNGECVYQITVKVWDRANKVIEHEKALRVTFNKHRSELRFDVPGAGKVGTRALAADPHLKELVTAIRKHFEANAKTMTGQKIRDAVQRELLRCGGQNLRRKAGGLYFVPSTYQREGQDFETKPRLDGLKAVLADLYGERADFYTIPLANDEGMQAMVRKHFVINAKQRAEQLAIDAWTRVRAGKTERGVRADLVTRLHNDHRRLLHDVRQFKDLVKVEENAIEDSLQDVEAALTALGDMREGSE